MVRWHVYRSIVSALCADRQRPASVSQIVHDGEVWAHGLPVNEDVIPFHRQTAALFDEDAFFPSLSLCEHLQMVARGHSVPDPGAAAAEGIRADPPLLGPDPGRTGVAPGPRNARTPRDEDQGLCRYWCWHS